MFDFATFADCNLLQSNMQFTSFAGSTFSHTLFTGSDMIQDNFSGIQSYQSSFDDSDLYNSRFIRAKLIDTSFRNCNVKKTVFRMIEPQNVLVWIPPVVASLITGPIATCVFKLEMNGAPISCGMGTCGLVGPIGVVTGWFEPSAKAVEEGLSAISPSLFDWTGLILVCVVLPAVICWGLGILFRKQGWIKDGDLTL